MIKVSSLNLSLLLMSLLLFACDYESQYDKGYRIGKEEGIKVGYNRGYNKGFTEGKNTGFSEGKEIGENIGYKSGYKNGTVAFVKEHWIPSLGLSVVTLLFFAFSFFTYKYLQKPTKRKINILSDHIEEKRQRKILQNEINRKLVSEEELAQLRSHNQTNIFFKSLLDKIEHDELKIEFEKIKMDIEEKIFRSRMKAINELYEKQLEVYEKTKLSKTLSDEEKTVIYQEIKQLLSN